MDFIEAINTRRSVRNYSEKIVEREIIEKLLDLAVKAPSSMNSQPWAFAVIQDSKMLKCYSANAKKMLLDMMDEYPRYQKYRAYLSDAEKSLFYNANTLVIIYAEPSGAYSNEDCCLAAENFMLAAHAIGLGTCWIGFVRPWLNKREIKEEMKIPLEYEAVAPIIVGYPADKLVELKKKPAKVLSWF